MPIIALPSNGEGGLNDTLSLKFGRCNNITIVSIEDGNIEAVKVIPIQKNKSLGNLGIYIANIIIDNEVSDVIVSFIGSKAFKAITSKDIKIFQLHDNDIVIKQCIELFTQGTMQMLEEPNAHLIEE